MSDDKHHRYEARTVWTCGPDGPPRTLETYSRNHRIEVSGKAVLDASSHPAFRGDPTRHNPEDLLVASLSSCHMLWYLHLAVVKKIAVHAYEDCAVGIMRETPRPGRFVEVVLRPGRDDRARRRRGARGATERAGACRVLPRQFGELPGTLRADDRRVTRLMLWFGGAGERGRGRPPV